VVARYGARVKLMVFWAYRSARSIEKYLGKRGYEFIHIPINGEWTPRGRKFATNIFKLVKIL
jgi:hypothetical protein